MNLTNHAKLRYVQRVLGIPQPIDAKQYIAQNDKKVSDDIQKLYSNSEHIWTGQFHDNITRNYYVRDDIILVTDTPNSAIITLWRVDFGFPDVVNRQTLKSMKAEIKKLQSKLDNEKDKVEKKIKQKLSMLSALEEQMKITESQLTIMKDKRDLLKQDLDLTRKDTRVIESEIGKITSAIVCSVDYKADLQEWKKIG